MNASKPGVVVLLTIAVLSTVVTIAGAAPSTTSTTATAVNNSATTATTTTTAVEATSTPTPTPTTTTSEESISEQAKDEVENAINGEETTSEQQTDCLTVTVNGGNTSTTECVPRFYKKVNDVTEVRAADWSGKVVTVVIHSETVQQVSLTDANGYDPSKRSGEISSRTEVLKSGLNVIRLPVTSASGDKGITIGTSTGDDNLDYISSPEKPFLANGLRTSLLYMAGLGGGVGTILVMISYVKYRSRKMKNGWTDVLEDYKP